MDCRGALPVIIGMIALALSAECLSQADPSHLHGRTTVRVPVTPGILANFDSLVSRVLPGEMDLSLPDEGADPVQTMRLTVVSRLRNSVTFPGELPAALYKVVLDGKEAVATRSQTGLDISVLSEDGLRVTAMSLNDVPANHTSREAPSSRYRADGFDGDVEYPPEPEAVVTRPESAAPLTVRIFLHDELRSTEARQIHAGYVAWWLSDMEVNVLPEETIDIVYLPSVPGFSDKPYGTPRFLTTWSNAVDTYARSRSIQPSWRNKYLLLTRKNPAEGKLGQAMPERGVAIAGLAAPYNVVAHELGHLFGAEHAKAELRVEGWWPCVTNMYTPDVPMLRNCYEYSAANIENIRRYVDQRGYIPPRWLGRAGL